MKRVTSLSFGKLGFMLQEFAVFSQQESQETWGVKMEGIRLPSWRTEVIDGAMRNLKSMINSKSAENTLQNREKDYPTMHCLPERSTVSSLTYHHLPSMKDLIYIPIKWKPRLFW